jgi:hypothetical protein
MRRFSIVLLGCLAVSGGRLPEAESADPAQPSASAPAAVQPLAAAADTAKLAAAKEKFKSEHAAMDRLTKSRDEELAALNEANRNLEVKEKSLLTDAELDAVASTSPTDKKRVAAVRELIRLRRDEWSRQVYVVQARWTSIHADRRMQLDASIAELDAIQPGASAELTATLEAERKKAVANGADKAPTLVERDIAVAKMKLKPGTQHQYILGVGEGDGGGYGGRSPTAKTRFLRLEYQGGDWAQDMELNPDLNLLIQYAAQTGQKVAEQPETLTLRRLGGFKIGFGPPFVYLTGAKSIAISKAEVQDLRKYLVDNCGMLLVDNGGSQQFHEQAFAMMKLVVPEITPVKIPLDDVIHTAPNELKALPYVAPHGGRDAWGWRLEGRWIAYYHPGDLGDAWADGHGGVPKNVSEACYDLGVNVMFYAYSENAKWRLARKFE